MPIKKSGLVRKTWWCPKWYWPFAVCSGIRTVDQWCYNFSWVKSTGYLFLAHFEGCENGILFTWNEPFVGVGQNTFVPEGEMCFESPRSSSGRCDSSNTGLQASGLSASAPIASDFDSYIENLESFVAESGTFEFTPENGGLCQQGMWPWKRTLHRKILTVSVVTRFASVQWYVGGAFIAGPTGNISFSTYCSWPFPLPKGRNQNRVVHLRYEVITEHNKSTLYLFNDPADGCYSIPVEMVALDNGREFASYYTSQNCRGETCDFDPAQIQELAKCFKRFSDLSNDKAKSRRPEPGEPVFKISNEIWQYVPEDRHGIVDSLLAILKNTYRNDPETFTSAANQVEVEIGLPGAIARFIKSTPEISPTQVYRRKGTRTIEGLSLLAIGSLIGILLVSLASRSKDK